MAQIADALPAQIAVLDRDGNILDTNRAWEAVADKGGLRADGGRAEPGWNYLEECAAAVGRGCAEAGEVALGISRVLGGESELFVKSYPCPFDGVFHWYQVMVTPAPACRPLGGAVVMHADVTALQHDPLTGLANRALFDAQLGLALAERADLVTGVLVIDLDRFKLVNDELGHRAGDRVLVEAARRLRGCVRAGDLPARLGGDEFAVVLSPTAEAIPGAAVAARVVEILGEPYRIDGRTLAVGASVGLALGPAHGRTAETLVEHADRALYAEGGGPGLLESGGDGLRGGSRKPAAMRVGSRPNAGRWLRAPRPVLRTASVAVIEAGKLRKRRPTAYDPARPRLATGGSRAAPATSRPRSSSPTSPSTGREAARSRPVPRRSGRSRAGGSAGRVAGRAAGGRPGPA